MVLPRGKSCTASNHRMTVAWNVLLYVLCKCASSSPQQTSAFTKKMAKNTELGLIRNTVSPNLTGCTRQDTSMWVVIWKDLGGGRDTVIYLLLARFGDIAWCQWLQEWNGEAKYSNLLSIWQSQLDEIELYNKLCEWTEVVWCGSAIQRKSALLRYGMSV